MDYVQITLLKRPFHLPNPRSSFQSVASVITFILRDYLLLHPHIEYSMYVLSFTILLKVLELQIPSSVLSQHPFPILIIIVIVMFYNYFFDYLSPSTST